MLFSSSLENHEKEYKKQLELKQINIEWQVMQNKIIQEAERMNLSQADIINKLEQAKQELINATINKIIP